MDYASTAPVLFPETPNAPHNCAEDLNLPVDLATLYDEAESLDFEMSNPRVAEIHAILSAYQAI